MKKGGLGRGINALIPENHIEEVREITNNKGTEEIEIHLIAPKKDQPRKNFNKEQLDELSDSIKIHGVLQPILLRPAKKGYELIAGERRWRAAQNAGLKKIPAIIKKLDDQMASEISLIENLQRENLNQIEEALALNDLMRQYGFTQEKLSERINKSRTYVTNTLRLLKLDSYVLQLISDNKISAGHGRTLLSIEDSGLQRKTAEQIIENKWSVRDTESFVKNLLKPKRNKKKKEKSIFIKDLETKMTENLGTKVSIAEGTKKGKIEIEYYGNEELERILNILS